MEEQAFRSLWKNMYYSTVEHTSQDAKSCAASTELDAGTVGPYDIRMSYGTGQKLSTADREDAVAQALLQGVEAYVTTGKRWELPLYRHVAKQRSRDLSRKHHTRREISLDTARSLSYHDTYLPNDLFDRFRGEKRLPEIVKLLLAGYTQEEIASKLSVTARTIRRDMKKITQILETHIRESVDDTLLEPEPTEPAMHKYTIPAVSREDEISANRRNLIRRHHARLIDAHIHARKSRHVAYQNATRYGHILVETDYVAIPKYQHETLFEDMAQPAYPDYIRFVPPTPPTTPATVEAVSATQGYLLV